MRSRETVEMKAQNEPEYLCTTDSLTIEALEFEPLDSEIVSALGPAGYRDQCCLIEIVSRSS